MILELFEQFSVLILAMSIHMDENAGIIALKGVKFNGQWYKNIKLHVFVISN